MIDLVTKTIAIGEKVEPIKSFECWFRTPFGICSRLENAMKQCEEQQWDANTVVVPVSVAVGSTLYEEIGRA
jgi:hypothetical protein